MLNSFFIDRLRYYSPLFLCWLFIIGCAVEETTRPEPQQNISPIITRGEPVMVGSLAELQEIADSSSLNGHYILTADIDLDNITFNPIGDYEQPFNGIFDGSANSVKNLSILQTANSDVGFFGVLGAHAVVKDLTIILKEDPNMASVQGVLAVGALAGSAQKGAIIEGVQVKGGKVKGDNYVGGLIGRNDSNSVSFSFSSAKVEGAKWVGGLLGSSKSLVTQSYATGDVSGDNTVGGLIGYSTGDIQGCYALGSVAGIGTNVGGLVGDSNGIVQESYAAGEVKAFSNVGGLIGVSHKKVTLSYAVGAVSGSDNVGGVVGKSDKNTPVTQIYATGSVTGLTGSSGHIGALVGFAGDDSLKNGYYSASTGQETAVGRGREYNIKFISTTPATKKAVEFLGAFGEFDASNNKFTKPGSWQWRPGKWPGLWNVPNYQQQP